jgi:predicted SAM-dependent methyltransferase
VPSEPIDCSIDIQPAMKARKTFADRMPESALHQVQKSWSPYYYVSSATHARLRRFWAKLGFNHDLASKLRYEMDMVLLRMRCALRPAYKNQVRGLAGRHGLLVHLGCGNALFPGWLNLDCYPPPPAKNVEILTLDLRRGLPLTAGSVAAVFSEHFLEHLPFETVGSVVLPDIRRVLQPGGRLRIGVPNGEYFIDQYVAYRAGTHDKVFQRASNNKTPMTMLNEIAHGYGHYFVYDFETMARLLTAAGFVNVRRCAPFDTSVEHFKGKDRIDDWRNAMTLYVEAEAASSPD